MAILYFRVVIFDLDLLTNSEPSPCRRPVHLGISCWGLVPPRGGELVSYRTRQPNRMHTLRRVCRLFTNAAVLTHVNRCRTATGRRRGASGWPLCSTTWARAWIAGFRCRVVYIDEAERPRGSPGTFWEGACCAGRRQLGGNWGAQHVCHIDSGTS